ncbi:MAG: hypothetical protein AABW64_02955 [Nanoarchaeota archaeon]
MEKGLIRLLESKVVKIAKLPKKNDVTGIRLEDLQGYTVPLISHDYAAKTPVMWNTLYESMRMPLRNIMVVADPKNTETILTALKRDSKYLGGGVGVCFKEAVIPYIDEVRPADLKAISR